MKSKNAKMLQAKCRQITRRTDAPVILEFNSVYSPYSWQIKIGDNYPFNTNFTAQELARLIDGFVMGFEWQRERHDNH
tara:strand:- start:4278 stop:4511 length:234 start_codon:yes stop_codon:yes gene_type:complete